MSSCMLLESMTICESSRTRAGQIERDSSGLQELRDEILARSAERRKTLIALANVSDNDSPRFWRERGGLYGDEPKADPRLSPDPAYKYRDKLREVWSDHQKAAGVMSSWVEEANDRDPWHVWRQDTTVGSEVISSILVLPNPSILPLTLALAVSQFLSRMAICKNPQCPNPYFLKKRSTQQFCDDSTCAAYGRREHKRKWWHENSEQWKRKLRGRTRHRKRMRRSAK